MILVGPFQLYSVSYLVPDPSDPSLLDLGEPKATLVCNEFAGSSTRFEFRCWMERSTLQNFGLQLCGISSKLSFTCRALMLHCLDAKACLFWDARDLCPPGTHLVTAAATVSDRRKIWFEPPVPTPNIYFNVLF